MLVSTLIERISYALRGTDDSVPTVGGDEVAYWLSTINRKKDEWATDPFEAWNSIFSLNAVEAGTVATTGTTALTGTSTYFTNFNVGDQITVSGETVRTIDTIVSDTSLTVTLAFTNTASGKTFTRNTIVKTSTQSYNLNTRFIRPSDDVYVTVAGQRVDFNLVEPQLRDSVSNAVYLAGKTLTFVDTISTDNQIVGGAITVPGFFLPPDMTSFTDVVPVDDPNWLALATAAEVAFNDVSYEDKSPDLFAKANSLYVAMKTANKKGTITAPRKVPTMVKRIGRADV